MARRIHLPLFLCLIFIAFSIGIAEAIEEENTLDLSNFPDALAEAFNIDEFSAGILASIFLMMACMFPVAIFARRNIYPSIFMGLLVLSFCIAVGYLPLFILVLVVLIVAGLWANKTKGWFA